MNRVTFNPAYFPAFDKGKPVDNGYIYVGIVDTDPEVVINQKPISVQQEDGNIVVVAQPLRTGAGGVPTYNGSPVTILVDGNYSLKITDSLNAQVYYVPSSVDSVAQVTRLDTYTDLKATTGVSDGQQASLSGRYSVGDNGGGLFIWNSGDFSTEVGNDPLNAIYVPPDSDPTGASGVWKREFYSHVAPEWFGGYTGTTVADDISTEVQAMIDWASQGLGRRGILFGAGSYYFTDILVPDTGANFGFTWEIEGVGMRKTLLRNSGSTPMFKDDADVNGTDGQIVLHVRDLDVLGGTGGAHGFHFSGQVYNSVFYKVLFNTHGNGFRFDNLSASGPFSNKWEHCLFNSTTEDGCYLSSGLASVFDNCYFQQIPVGTGKAGIRMLSSGATFNNCNGLDAGDYLAIIGSTVATDGVSGAVRTIFLGQRFESFSVAGVWFKTDANEGSGGITFHNPVFIGEAGSDYDIKAEFSGTNGNGDVIQIFNPANTTIGGRVAPIYANLGNVIVHGGGMTTLTTDGIAAVPVSRHSYLGLTATTGVGNSVPTQLLQHVAIRYASELGIGANRITQSTDMPTTGSYTAGDFVKKEVQTIETWSGGFAGLSGAKYVLWGWVRITTGSNHVLNTDWTEFRVLTGQ